MKRRTHGVVDDEADLALPNWAGVIPLSVTAGAGIPDSGVTVAPPVYVPTETPWRQPPTLRGAHVAIEPLDLAHAGELFAALADAEVWEHNPARRPASVAEHAQIIAAGLADPGRVPLLIRDAVTGEAIGTSSYYGINETNETIAIGYTQFARARWRTAANTESKLLMMAHAFDTLGAGRVEWHTDVRNTRSQAAIERLGATREGVLRRHKRRSDGTWRDTVQYAMTVDEWPTARNRLAARLAAGNTG
jgi:RimJ/RimL family protein N-acetyltransferase